MIVITQRRRSLGSMVSATGEVHEREERSRDVTAKGVGLIGPI